MISVNNNILADISQIASGVYSPIKSFMNLDETMTVLENNSLLDGNAWTLPILFQADNDLIQSIPKKGSIYLKKKGENQPFTILNIHNIEIVIFCEELKWPKENLNFEGIKKSFIILA